MDFIYVRKVNITNGETVDELFSHSFKTIIRPWSELDDSRYPRAGCTLQNCETLIVEERTGEVYAVNTGELMRQGIHLPVTH